MTDPMHNRRELLAGAAGTLLAGATAHKAMAQRRAARPAATTSRSFPRGFRWGTATAGHQIEGNNVNSDLWLLENIRPTTFVDRSGDACDSYHRFDEDIALMARLGFNTFRMSVEWARIEPDRDQFSNAEIDHYRRVLATCRQHGIQPAVTFLHTTMPRWVAELGGWLNPEVVGLFARFCGRTARALAGDMAYAFTINEPQVSTVFRVIPAATAYFRQSDERERASHAAAARATGSDRYVTLNYPASDEMTPNLIAGHEQAFQAIKAERSALPVGVTLSVTDFQPANEGARAMVADIRERAYGPWNAAVRAHSDFVAPQIYRQVRLPGPGAALPAPPPMPFTRPGDMNDAMMRPEAVRNAIEYMHQATGKPVFVTENGIETDNDARRVWYIDQVLQQLHDTIAAGTPMIGYLHWSLLDNFEWNRGYGPKFGLVAVDRTTFRRTPKPSAARLSVYARANALI